MELDALKFTVETTALDDAITKVGTLQLAVKKLGSDTGSQSARQAAKEQAQITLDQVKAETALIEARGKQARAIENLNSPQEKLTKSVRDSNAVLERQEKIYENMINYGLSKGQASTLAMAQAQDIAAESAQKLVDVMKDTRKYIGGDTFDKSTAGMTAMQNRYETLLIAAKNYADGSVLNIRQAQDLALDTERLAAKNQLLGIAGAEAAASINSMTAAFKTLAIQENEQARANDAHAALIKKNSEAMALAERERVAAHLNSGQVLFENNQLRLKQDQQTNKAIMNEMAAYYKAIEAQDLAHSKALLKSGKAQVDTTGNAAVALFVKDQEAKAKAVAKSAEDQVKALAKADEMLARLQNRTKEMSKESPVSATAANQLYAYEKALKAAGVGATEATARLAVFRAEQQKVSQLARSEETLRMQHLSRALAPQVTDVTVGLMTGQNPFTVFLQQGGQIRDQIGLSQVATENLGKVFKDTFVMMGAMVAAMGKALVAFMLTPTGAVVTALAALALTVYEVSKILLQAERSTLVLTKALELNASTIGKTISQMQGLSAEVSSVSTITSTQAAGAIAELSKTSAIADENFVKATISAINFERYAGVAISETVNMYKEIAKDPIKALIKLQEETGRLNVLQIEHIETLIKQGDKEKAVAELSKYMADSQAKSADRIKESLTGMSRAVDKAHDDFIAFGKWFTDPFETKTLETRLKEAEDKLFTSLQNQQKMKRLFGFSFGTEKEQAAVDVLAGSIAFNNALSSQKKLQKERTDGEAALLALRLKYADKVDSREASRVEAKLALEKRLTGSSDMTPEDIAKATESYGKTLELINRKEKKPKEEKTDSFSISLSNELQQYEKQYGIEIKLQDDFIRQEKARLDNALAAKEITQGEFNARDLAASERGYTDRQALSDKYYSGIIQSNEKNISEMVQQYQEWVNQEGGTPKFFEQNEKAVETLRSKIINTNNETSVFLEKIQASAASAKETAFTRYSKQLSTLQGEIRGVTLAYDEYLQSEANLTKQKQAQVALEDKVRFATPEQALAIKAAADETERLTKQVQEYDKQIRASKMSLDASVDIYLEQVSLTGEVTEQTQILLDKEIERYELLKNTKKLIESTVESKATEAYSAATLKSQKDQMKALSDSVAGAIETGLFEGGDAGSKSLRKIIEAELRKPITIFIKAVVGDIFGGVTGETTGASGGMAGGSGLLSTLSSAYDALAGKLSFSGSNSYINAANSSLGGSLGLSNTFGTSATAGQMAYTEALMSGATAAEANTAALTASQANLTTFGKGVGMAGDALAGYGLQKAISGDKTIAGGKVVDAITIAASAMPGIGPIAGVIAGLANRAFGMGALEMTGAGTRGTFGTSGFQGQNYQNYKRGGGWLSSDENTTDISAVPASSVKAWSTAFTSVKKSMKDATESIGLSAESFKDYSKYVDVAAGTTAEGLAALFTGMADEMVQGLLGTTETIVSTIGTIPDFFPKEFAKQFNKEVTTKIWHPSDLVKEGETASETILRLSSSLKEVNTWFGFLGSTLLKVSLVSADTASKLADVFGGLDKFSAAASEYYVDFYSEQERASKSSLDMAKALALVGLELPKTKEAFRELVTEVSKNLDTAPMREAYALLLKIAPEFSSVVDVFDKANKEMFELLKTTASDSLSTLTKVVSKEKEKLQTVYDTTLKKLNTELSVVNDSVSKLSSLASSLKSTLDNLRITGSEGDYRKQAQSQISQALAKARTGTLPLNGELTSALSTVSKPSEALFGSFVDYARDFYKTVNDITELSDITGKKLTADELTQSLLNKQIETLTLGFEAENARLDGILEKAQEQLDAANGVNNSILSVKEAIEGLTTALNGMAGAIISSLKSGTIGSQEAIAKLTGTTGGSLSSNQWSAVKTATGSTDVWASSGGAAALKDASGSQTIYAKSGEVFTAQQAIDSVNQNLAKGNAAQVYADAKRTGISAASLDALMGWSAGTSNAWATANKLPSFAIGTNFVPNDMVANIHKGERIIPAADNTLLMQKLSSTDNTALLQEIKSLKEEVINLRYEQRADVDQNSKISKVLTRVSKNGESLQVITGAVYNIPA